MKTCQLCLLNSNYRNIKFDKDGICNYCRTYSFYKDRLTDFNYNKRLLEDRFNSIRGKYDYDCLVGISGGKDSSYLAWQLKNKYGLRILTFTFDNGFLTDYAKRNIEIVIKKLNVDHFFHRTDWNIHKEFYRQAVLHFGYPCPACAYSSYAFMNKLAFEKKIPFCVHGRSRAQMFKELLNKSIDPFLPFIKNNLSTYSIEKNKETALKALRRLEYLLKKIIKDSNLRQAFYKDFYPDIEEYKKSNFAPEFLGYFLYEKYDEKKITKVLEEELHWVKPEDSRILTHSDCLVHDAAMYLYNQVFGYSLLSLELSVMIREGVITREDAENRLNSERCLSEIPNKSLDILCEKCNIKRKDINRIISGAKKRHELLKLALKFKYIFHKPHRLDF
ncbi:MAG: hypothetical protein B1H08_01955 [Candidatus Omnitrophica bacterium 4484_171]|nr:MAG: hypothetical protein B1H08_01955 [Candidatus Omnitrophica bacterium 4484_171]